MLPDLQISFADISPEWFLLAIATGMVAWGTLHLCLAASSMGWKKERGRVEGARVKSPDFLTAATDRGECSVEVSYSYEVGGKRYSKSEQVFPAAGEMAELVEAEWEKAKYKERDAIDVFVDPESPERSTLIPGATRNAWGLVGAGLLLAMLGGVIRRYGLPELPKRAAPVARPQPRVPT